MSPMLRRLRFGSGQRFSLKPNGLSSGGSPERLPEQALVQRLHARQVLAWWASVQYPLGAPAGGDNRALIRQHDIGIELVGEAPMSHAKSPSW